MGSEPRLFGLCVDCCGGVVCVGDPLSEATCRAIVRERSGNLCERCGGLWPPVTHHHRLKRSAGGKWSPDNIGALCGHGTSPDGCHSWVESHPNYAEAEGWHCRPWHKPVDIPVLYRGRNLFLLPDGSVCEGRREEETIVAPQSGGVSDGSTSPGEREDEDGDVGAAEVPASGETC